MTREGFFPLPSNVDGLWVNTDKLDTLRRPVQVRNMTRWDEIAAERAHSVHLASIWRDAAVQDGWAITPTYAGETQTSACTLLREGYKCLILTRPSKRPVDDSDRGGLLGGGEVHCWGPDRPQIPVPLVYPGWQYFLDALVTCPHCHRGPNRRFFVTVEPCEYCGPGKYTGLPSNACENCMNTGAREPELLVPVATKSYSFAGRACEQCVPELRRIHEQPGWND